MNKYYKVMPIDVLPQESGRYHFCLKASKRYIFTEFNSDFEHRIMFSQLGYDHWLKPITLTLHELLQTDEGKEIIREVFKDARRIIWEPLHQDTVFEYQTADDFINNTK
jgi:hypothetical protein